MIRKLINCPSCNGLVYITPHNNQQGSMKCPHPRCGQQIPLNVVSYSDAAAHTLEKAGELVHQPTGQRFNLSLGQNTIGTGSQCQVILPRFTSNGRCYISRAHCTLSLSFDNRTGRIIAKIKDGVTEDGVHGNSTNGTFLNNYRLLPEEELFVDSDLTIILGGADSFRLVLASLSAEELSKFEQRTDFNPDLTQ